MNEYMTVDDVWKELRQLSAAGFGSYTVILNGGEYRLENHHEIGFEVKDGTVDLGGTSR